ncbi:MAG: NAD-dependent epimerase/dehydratase family protein [Psychrobium sp.]|nr:NAD-dependent epimerase/dehydratase family protein [Psychrobium sp.]
MIEFDSLHPAEQQALLALKESTNNVFVTGAGGFLGQRICRILRAGDINVTGFARSQYPELVELGVVMIQGDISDLAALSSAMQGSDLIFHVASKAGVWGSKQSYYQPNVDGARNVIDAAKELGITRLVYTSTPSVTFAGVDEENIDESQPYASSFLNYYAQSKALAEEMMLNANSDDLKTIAIRPHLIWGPNDPHLVPRVIARAQAGRLKLVGDKDKLVDTIYIDNAAYVHILAAVTLADTNSSCAGKAYFVSNDQPITMKVMLNKILACANLPAVSKRVPAGLAFAVGCVLEKMYLLLGKTQEPMMTRFVARQLSTSHYFDISAAKRDLGYQPIVSIDEGMTQLALSLRNSKDLGLKA